MNWTEWSVSFFLMRILKVKNCSFDHSLNIYWVVFDSIKDDDKWNDVEAWSWKTDFEDTAEQTSKMSTDWLQTCLTSMSPQSQILVIANMDRYAVLVGKFLPFGKGNYYSYQRIIFSQVGKMQRPRSPKISVGLASHSYKWLRVILAVVVSCVSILRNCLLFQGWDHLSSMCTY